MEQILDIVIIGSGPAGMAAGIYAKRAGLSSIIIENFFPSRMLHGQLDA